jgi:hypothetical protein
MVVSQGEEGTILFEFMAAAGQQNHYPGYALSSQSFITTVATQPGVKQHEIRNARGVGWVPPFDTVDRKQWERTAAPGQCVSRLKAQGTPPSTSTDYLSSYETCDLFGLYDAILRRTNGDSAPGPVQGAVDVAGGGLTSALNADDRTGFWDHGRLGPADGRFFGWVDSKGGFAYTSDPFRFRS